MEFYDYETPILENLDELPDANYFREQKMYTLNYKLRKKISTVVKYGLGSLIVMSSPNLEDHLDQLMENQKSNFKEMRNEINNFSYLEERVGFMRNPKLKEKLLKIVRSGKGNLVNVFHPEFMLHVDELLN